MIAVDPLYVDELEAACRVCSCTDRAACFPTCSWVDDPLGLGPLCSRCLAIATAVTDRDVFAPDSHLLGFAIVAIAGVVVGILLALIIIGRLAAG